MSDHIPDTNKMVSDTPRTDAELEYDNTTVDGVKEFARQLERELNAANESFRKLNIHALDLAARIQRLEEAGDAMATWLSDPRNLGDDPFMSSQWRKAKEAKP